MIPPQANESIITTLSPETTTNATEKAQEMVRSLEFKDGMNVLGKKKTGHTCSGVKLHVTTYYWKFDLKEETLHISQNSL